MVGPRYVLFGILFVVFSPLVALLSAVSVLIAIFARDSWSDRINWEIVREAVFFPVAVIAAIVADTVPND